MTLECSQKLTETISWTVKIANVWMNSEMCERKSLTRIFTKSNWTFLCWMEKINNSKLKRMTSNKILPDDQNENRCLHFERFYYSTVLDDLDLLCVFLSSLPAATTDTIHCYSSLSLFLHVCSLYSCVCASWCWFFFCLFGYTVYSILRLLK